MADLELSPPAGPSAPAATEDDLRAAFLGKRVLVTGCTGFKGSWLCAWLLRLGAEVRGLSLPPPTRPALWDQAALGERVPWDRVDLRHRRQVAAAVAAADPELVFHLAAQARVPAARRDPLATLATNTLGTAHLLEALRQRGRPVGLLLVSSDKCYAPDPTGRPHTEADALGGDEPYAASKAAAELVLAAWRASWFPPAHHAEHGVALASARAGNAIGPGDHAPDRLVPDILRALAAGRRLRLRHPAAVRPWQHVLAPLWGYLLLGRRLLPGAAAPLSGAWNFGPPPADCVPVGALVDAFAAAGGLALETAATTGAPDETALLRLDATKARRELGWRSPWSLGETVAATVRGARQLAAGQGAAVLDQQIAAFAAALSPPAAEAPGSPSGAAAPPGAARDGAPTPAGPR